jgi:hypothetical protein
VILFDMASLPKVTLLQESLRILPASRRPTARLDYGPRPLTGQIARQLDLLRELKYGYKNSLTPP